MINMIQQMRDQYHASVWVSGVEKIDDEIKNSVSEIATHYLHLLRNEVISHEEFWRKMVELRTILEKQIELVHG